MSRLLSRLRAVVLCGAIVCICRVAGNLLPKELHALQNLYDSTQGPNWNWFNRTGAQWDFTPGCNPCTEHWEGISCNVDNLHVIRISLQARNLVGTIPDTIGDLSDLTIVDLTYNSVNGTIPLTIGQSLTRLARLVLTGNYLKGTIPEAIASLPGLRSLRLDHNFLEGTIPPALWSHPALTVLLLGTNHLTGSIPEYIDDRGALREVTIVGNRLTGTLPSSLTNLTQLRTLALSENRLDGTLPDAICRIYLLGYFAVDQNGLHGTLPPCLGNRTSLEKLLLNENAFTGTVPAGYATLPKLIYLWLSQNLLTGPVPPYWPPGSKMAQLFLHENLLTGTIPASIGNLNKLTLLELSRNFLTGPIPDTIGNMASLEALEIFQNLLTGRVPTSLSQLSTVYELYLHNNHLSGNLEGVFNAAQQKALLIVQLSNNRLTGTLPPEAFLAPQLNTFVAVSNCFSGTLPSQICQNLHMVSLILDGLQTASQCRKKVLPGLSTAYTTDNRFGGTIPPCLFQMPNLSSLHLSGSGLTGSLPDAVALTRTLFDFTASHNLLSGTLPDAFQMRPWWNLDLSYNRLTGSLRPEFAAVGTPILFERVNISYGSGPYLQNNRLSGVIPHALQHHRNVSVLSGNIFSCELNGSDLPAHDSERHNYQCGSDSFNASYYLFLGLLVLFLGLVVVLRSSTAVPRLRMVQAAKEALAQWSPRLDELPGNYLFVCAVMDLLCTVGVGCTALILLVLVPWYATASHYFGTYTHQYGWVVSAAFLSGVTPTLVQLVIFLALLVAALASFAHLMARLGLSERLMNNSTVVRRLFSVALDSPASGLRYVAVYVTFISVNIVVVGGVNVVFVLIALYSSRQALLLAQIGLSIFKLLWSNQAMPFMVRRLSYFLARDSLSTGFVATHVVTALFNNIAIPCLVVFAVSPNCFYNAIVAAPKVDSTFVYKSCKVLATVKACYGDEIDTIRSSYFPPFAYSYQCSSSFITYYAPAFVYLALAATFGFPLLMVVLVALHKHFGPDTWQHHAVDAVLFSALKPVRLNPDGSVVRNPADPFFAANVYMICLVTYLGILLTFGVVFPPLAVAMCMTMLSVAWQGKLAVGRLIHNARQVDPELVYKVSEILEQESMSAVTVPKLRWALFTVVCFSCWFYALFLFDTLGDGVGHHDALWVVIVLMTFPLVVLALFALRARLLVTFPVFREKLRTKLEQVVGGGQRSQSSHRTDSSGHPQTDKNAEAVEEERGDSIAMSDLSARPTVLRESAVASVATASAAAAGLAGGAIALEEGEGSETYNMLLEAQQP